MEQVKSPAALLEALKADDQDAWNRFFERFDTLIMSVVSWSKWRFDEHAREDVSQTIRAELLRSIKSVREEARLAGFIKRLCVNRCVDAIRRKVRDGEHLQPLVTRDEDGHFKESDVPTDDEYDPVEDVVRFERAELLRGALSEIDETCRDAIDQFYVKGLSYKEMAETQGVTVNTVGSRLSRCLGKMRSLLSSSGLRHE